MTAYPQQINVRQNDPGILRMLLAAHRAHQTAQRVELVRAVIVLLTVGFAIAATAYEDLRQAMVIAGVMTTLLTAIGLPLLSRRFTLLAATIQEEFDTQLFELPPSQAHLGKTLPELLNELADKAASHLDSKRNWYIDVSELPRAYAVLLCQRENLVWDYRQRRVWGLALVGAGAGWWAVGLVVALTGDWTVRELFTQWLAPSLALIVYCATEATAQLDIANTKRAEALRVESDLASSATGDPEASDHHELLVGARRLQDQITSLRKKTERIPEWLYRRRRGREETAAARSADAIRQRLLGL